MKAHRGKVMQKMRAPSLADLVRMAAKLDAKTDAKHELPARLTASIVAVWLRI